jgi:sulfate adenylyltransferase subunit 1
MPWYDGLLDLEALEKTADVYEKGQARFPVQTVVRPKTSEYKGICRKYMVII